MTPRYVVVHTSDSTAPEIDIRDITKWHQANGWRSCGYHYVILDANRHDKSRDGEVQTGRVEGEVGAHCKGLNHQSIGICLIGDGDQDPPTEAQWKALVELCSDICLRHNLKARHVIGHREINRLVDGQIVSRRYRTSKTCPGAKIDLDELRDAVREALTRRTCE